MNADVEAIKNALDYAHDCAMSELRDAEQMYGQYPRDGLGRKITRAEDQLGEVEIARSMLRQLAADLKIAYELIKSYEDARLFPEKIAAQTGEPVALEELFDRYLETRRHDGRQVHKNGKAIGYYEEEYLAAKFIFDALAHPPVAQPLPTIERILELLRTNPNAYASDILSCLSEAQPLPDDTFKRLRRLDATVKGEAEFLQKIDELERQLAAQTGEPQAALIDAAEKHLANFDGQEEPLCRSDILNAFFAGARYAHPPAREPVAFEDVISKIECWGNSRVDTPDEELRRRYEVMWEAVHSLYARPPVAQPIADFIARQKPMPADMAKVISENMSKLYDDEPVAQPLPAEHPGHPYAYHGVPAAQPLPVAAATSDYAEFWVERAEVPSKQQAQPLPDVRGKGFTDEEWAAYVAGQLEGNVTDEPDVRAFVDSVWATATAPQNDTTLEQLMKAFGEQVIRAWVKR